MFGDLSFWQMILKGGVITMALLAVSVISWWIIIERAIRFSRIRVAPGPFMEKIKKNVRSERMLQ